MKSTVSGTPFSQHCDGLFQHFKFKAGALFKFTGSGVFLSFPRAPGMFAEAGTVIAVAAGIECHHR
jgi:hypothetical protein